MLIIIERQAGKTLWRWYSNGYPVWYVTADVDGLPTEPMGFRYYGNPSDAKRAGGMQ